MISFSNKTREKEADDVSKKQCHQKTMNRHQDKRKIIQSLNWFQNEQKLSASICDQQLKNSDIITKVILNSSDQQNTQSTKIYLYWDKSQCNNI